MSDFRIGNQSFHSARTILRPFTFALHHRFTAFEWFPDCGADGTGWSEDDFDKRLRSRLRQIATRHDVRQSVHFPGGVDVTGPHSQKRVESVLTFARDLGAKLLVIHFSPEEGPEGFVEKNTAFFREVTDAGLYLAVENTPGTVPADMNRLFRVLQEDRRVDASLAGMCFDAGHANLCEETRNDYILYMDRLEAHVPISHVHLHENYGRKDAHLAVFSGSAGKHPEGIHALLNRLRRRNFHGSIIFEQWPDQPRLLLEAKENMTALIHQINHGKDARC